jgi:membrane protease YdiL (CAAX protease family)
VKQTSRKQSNDKPDQQNKTIPYPQLVIIFLWIAAEIILFFEDRTTALIALGFGFFMILLWLVVKRVVPESASSEQNVLQAVGSRKQIIARSVVVAGAIALTFAHLLAVNKVIALPRLETALQAIANLAPSLGSGLPNFTLFVLLPGVLIVALGARRRELGLTRPTRRTVLATLLVISLFLLSWIWRLAHGQPTISALGLFLLHNLLSNGFSEEFQTKGLVLSHLRAWMRTEWALVVMALLVALLHSADAIHDEPNLIGILANGIALNVPMNYLLGRAALRTRSLFLPVMVHLTFDTTRNVWM